MASVQIDNISARCRSSTVPLCTADCNSIDRFLYDTAPNVCLPFDGIGARHLGTHYSCNFTKRAGTSSTHSNFYLLGRRTLVVRLRVKLLNFMDCLLEGVGWGGLRPTGLVPGTERHAGVPGPNTIKR